MRNVTIVGTGVDHELPGVAELEDWPADGPNEVSLSQRDNKGDWPTGEEMEMRLAKRVNHEVDLKASGLSLSPSFQRYPHPCPTIA